MRNVVFFAIILFFFASQARAYVPPSEFLIKKMVAKRNDLKKIQIVENVIAFENDKPSADHFKLTTTIHFQKGKFESRAVDDLGHVLFVLERDVDRLPLKDVLLSNPDFGTVVRRLKEAGVPIKTEDELLLLESEEKRRAVEFTHLSKWKRGVAWVIGPGETGAPVTSGESGEKIQSPQLWIVKDAFLPLLLRVPSTTIRKVGDGIPSSAASPSYTLGFEFENFHTYQGLPYPHSITWLQWMNGKAQVILKEDLLEMQINAKDSMKDSEPRIQPSAESQAVASPSLQKLVQRYLEAFN